MLPQHAATPQSPRRIGIDTSRYGHYAVFLRDHLQPAADERAFGLPPFYVPGTVRVGSTVTDVSSARRGAAESERGHIAPNSAGVRYLPEP
jgi:hypothetical protein